MFYIRTFRGGVWGPAVTGELLRQFPTLQLALNALGNLAHGPERYRIMEGDLGRLRTVWDNHYPRVTARDILHPVNPDVGFRVEVQQPHGWIRSGNIGLVDDFPSIAAALGAIATFRSPQMNYRIVDAFAVVVRNIPSEGIEERAAGPKKCHCNACG